MSVAPWPPGGSRAQALLSNLVGALVFLALACLFVDRSLSGNLISAVAVIGLVLLAVRRDPDRTDLQFLLVVAVLPLMYLVNMLIHGFGGSILGRPARLLIGFLAFYAVRRSQLSAALFFDGCATGAIAAGLIAMSEVELQDAERADATWNAVPFGNYSLLLGVLLLCALLAQRVRPPVRLGWYVAGVAMAAVALALSRTRGSWVAVPVLAYLLSHAHAGIRGRTRAAVAVALLVAAIGVASVSAGLQARLRLAADDVAAYLAAPHSLQALDTPVGLRLGMWRWGLERFAEHPIVGIGLVNYGEQRRESVTRGEMPQQFLTMSNVHNQLIHFLAVGGVLMGSALVVFWVLAARFFLTRMRTGPPDGLERALPLAGLCIIVGTGLFSMSGALFGTGPDTWAFAILLCMAAAFTTARTDGSPHTAAKAA